jgi:translation initiation factor eIF-2B subunit delta
MAELRVTGEDARCVALLRGFQDLIREYKPASSSNGPRAAVGKDLLQRINKHVDFLLKFRPMGAAMGNATRFVKIQVGLLPQDALSDWPVHRDDLLEVIEHFLRERVELAAESTVRNATDKIFDGDVVLTYSNSGLVTKTLLEANRQGKRFSVVVLDSRPRLDGTEMLSRLTSAGISCQYADVVAATYMMREVTKVLLGASAILANGNMYMRAGSSSIAAVAKSMSVPVIVLAETNKFHERVQLDAITQNELFDPRDLLRFDWQGPSPAELEGAEELPTLTLLNIYYDVMPADFATVVATEAGLIPPSSVPAILREYRKDLHLFSL